MRRVDGFPRWLRPVLCLTLVGAAVAVAPRVVSAQTPSRVIRQIDQRCANCHTGIGADAAKRAPDVEGAPAYATLRQMAPDTILRAITTGAMRVHAEGIPDDVKRAMAEYISGRKLAPLGAGDAKMMPNRCTSNPGLANIANAPVWNGWSPDAANTRFQRNGGINAADVPRLVVKWAFGFPGVSSVYGQPTIAGGRVFVGVDTGYVYALDAKTGCVHWTYLAETGVRNAVSIGPIPGSPGQYAAYFGDMHGRVYAVNAQTGQQLWKVWADTHPLAVVTGSPALHEGRLYVPMSSREEAAGGSLNYPCCTFRGSIIALDAATGKELWKSHAIPDAPVPTRRNSAGTQLWTNSGAAIWHAPTIDPRNGALYVATGDAYTEPAHKNTDAVMALDMKSGKILWSVQDFENDVWLVACAQEPTENCPRDLGPDYDFGSAPILMTLPNGRRVLLAGQKSGQVHAHDPDDNGKHLWTATLVEKIGESEILFGGAADERTAYFALDNGTVAALDPATGQRKWFLPPRPAGPRRGVTAALTAIPGVVFAGFQSGMLGAYAAETGHEIWSVDTLKEFPTVNQVSGKGGSMGAPGPTVAGGMLYVGSGYVGLGNGTPGNVLLAFGLP